MRAHGEVRTHPAALVSPLTGYARQIVEAVALGVGPAAASQLDEPCLEPIHCLGIRQGVRRKIDDELLKIVI